MDQNEHPKSSRHFNVAFKFLENLDSGIIVLNSNLEILFWNRWLELQTGKKAVDVYLKKLDSLYPSIKSVTLRRKVNTALRMNSPTFYTSSTSGFLIPISLVQFTSTTFEKMQQDITITPFDIEKNEVMVSITDQTRMASLHRKTQDQLLEIQHLNRQLVQERNVINENVMLCKFDAKGTIYDVSDAYLKFIEYEKHDYVDQNLFKLEKLQLNETLVARIKNCILAEKSMLFEQELLSKSGVKYWVNSALVPEYNSEHICEGYTMLRVNISDKKRVQEQQEQLLYQSRNAAMGEMISMIAHQWRQPLTLINSIMIGVKVDEELGILEMDKVQKSFDKIEETVKSLSSTIDDFKNFFKPKKEKDYCVIQELLEKGLFFLAPLMRQLHIEYKIICERAITVEVFENELIQVFINIFKNAIDEYEKQEGDGIKMLNVRVKEKSSYVMIEIEDNAGGISNANIQSVFEPYFSTKSKNGTGLGLYMSRMIIEEHFKGHLSVQSENETTCFTIEIPK